MISLSRGLEALRTPRVRRPLGAPRRMGATTVRRLTIVAMFGLIATSSLARTAEAQALRSLSVSAGYSLMRDPAADLNFPIGWTVDAAGRVNGWLSAVAEATGSHQTTHTIAGDLRFSVHTVMVGARASARIGPFIEFGQVLVGAVHGTGNAFGAVSSSTNAGVKVGGGLDCAVTRKLSARGQVDVRSISATAGREVRIVAGVVYAVF